MQGTKNIDDLVEIVVHMRESRDGLVETPAQFRFIADLLSISIGSRRADVETSGLMSYSCKNISMGSNISSDIRNFDPDPHLACAHIHYSHFHLIYENLEVTTISVLLLISLVLSLIVILR